MKPSFLIHDNKSDRKELHYLLSRLSPARRVRFLERCCAMATLKNTPKHPAVSLETYALARQARTDDAAGDRLTMDVYLSLWALAVQFDFDLGRAAVLLEQMVR